MSKDELEKIRLVKIHEMSKICGLAPYTIRKYIKEHKINTAKKTPGKKGILLFNPRKVMDELLSVLVAA